jgi:2-C-methyl-D-erythritol 4-phosphate cytidylyltransferase
MGGVDKTFAPLLGEPVLARVVNAFQSCTAVDQVVIVLPEHSLQAGQQFVAGHAWPKVSAVVAGGARRQDSVLNGLEKLDNCRWAVIHDGARPLVTPELIERGLSAAEETGASIAAVPVTDTIKIAADDLTVQGTPPRRNLWSVQTPQVFRCDLLVSAYRQLRTEVTDDSAAVERAEGRVRIYLGAYDNIKITTPDDLDVAELLLRKRGG